MQIRQNQAIFTPSLCGAKQRYATRIFFFMLWCLSDSIINYLSVSEKVNEVVFFLIQENKAGGTPPPKTEPCIIAVVITILYLHIVTGCIDLHILMYTSGLHISASMPTVFNVPVILHSPQTQQQL